MRQIIDSVWQRRGTSWIWDAEALAHEYPQEILLRDGAKSAGLFHLRIT